MYSAVVYIQVLQYQHYSPQICLNDRGLFEPLRAFRLQSMSIVEDMELLTNVHNQGHVMFNQYNGHQIHLNQVMGWVNSLVSLGSSLLPAHPIVEALVLMPMPLQSLASSVPHRGVLCQLIFCSQVEDL